VNNRSAGRAVGIIPVREADILEGGTPRMLGGKPLLAYTVQAALDAASIVRVVVSTEGEGAAGLARSLGADVPFLRPAELARPGVSIWQVLRHGVQWLAEQESDRFDTVVLLETSHPVRPVGLVDRVVEALHSSDCDSVLTAQEERHAFWMQTPSGEIQQVGASGDATRDGRLPLFREAAGLACASRTRVVFEGRGPGRNVGLVPVRSWFGLIDTQDPFGLLVAETLLSAMAAGAGPAAERFVGIPR
jgi:CMP-N-acetylneuraminic acid synthetase